MPLTPFPRPRLPHRLMGARSLSTRLNRLRCLGGLLLVCAFPADRTAAADADTQFTLLDVSSEWTTTRQFRKERDELPPQPEQWGAPVDFANGTLFIRLEIFEKPSDIEVISMLCLWQGKNECCSRRVRPELIRFDQPGVYYGTLAAPGEGDDELGNALWSRPRGDRFFQSDRDVDRVQIQWWVNQPNGDMKILREHSWHGGVEPGDLGPEARRHIPIRYRMEIHAVAKGAAFVAPDHWDVTALPAASPPEAAP